MASMCGIDLEWCLSIARPMLRPDQSHQSQICSPTIDHSFCSHDCNFRAARDRSLRVDSQKSDYLIADAILQYETAKRDRHSATDSQALLNTVEHMRVFVHYLKMLLM